MSAIYYYSPEYHFAQTYFRTSYGSSFSEEEYSAYPVLGAIPGIGIFSGGVRSILGLIDVVRAIYYAVITGNKEWPNLFQVGSQNMVRGIVEAIPVVGTFCLLVDLMKVDRQKDENQQHFSRIPTTSFCMLYLGDRPICSYQGSIGLSHTVERMRLHGTPVK